jgi:UDP-N-acetyl-D-glucosamine dehydrogenase
MKVAIVGMGYVGLPLALRFAEAGVPVLGVDVDAAKCDALNAGRSYIKHVPAALVAQARVTGRLEATTEFARAREVDAILLCVPTPLNAQREPDMTYVFGTGESLAPHLRKGQLVVLESTTYPGTTDTDLRAILERGSGLVAGRDFHLAFSPEREDPGSAERDARKIPKVVGGLTPACRDRAVACYERVVERVVPVSSCRVAEAAKLLENIYRAVNIALVNELKVVYTAMGIDVWEVIEAARTKPFGFMPFYPGPGLGGHCIPIDPFYLAWKARQFGQDTRFIKLAGEINTAMPLHVVNRTAEALAAQNKTLAGGRVLIIGLAYKPNVDDERESPGYALMEIFKSRGAAVAYHDPHVPVIRPTREHAHWAGTRSADWNREALQSFDAVIIVTNHASVNYQELAGWSPCIVDTRNAMAGVATRPGQVWKA